MVTFKKYMAALASNDLILMVAVALTYFLSARLGLLLAVMDNSVTLFWPASGIALTALLVYGQRLWPAIFVGAVAGYLDAGALPALGIALGATLEAAAGVYLLRALGFDLSMAAVKDVFILFISAGISVFISALNGSFWLALSGAMAWSSYPDDALYWWMGDLLGVMMFTPLLLAWVKHKPLAASSAMQREAVAWFALLLLLCVIVFSNVGFHLLNLRIGPLVLLAVFVWSSLRFDLRITIAGAATVFAFSMFSMLQNSGAYFPVTQESVLELWAYNMAICVYSLVLAVANFQRLHTGESLRRSQVDLQLAQNVANTGSWRYDILAGEWQCSTEFRRIFGLPDDIPLNLDAFTEGVHPDDREDVLYAWRGAMKGMQYEIEHRVQSGNKTRWIKQRTTLTRGPRGEPSIVTGTIQDITSRKETEARLHLAAKVFESSGEAIMITDSDSKIVAINQAFTEITGYEESELLGNNPGVLESGLHEHEFFRSMWKDIEDKGNWQGEIWNKRKNGQIFPMWMKLYKLTDERGSTVNYISVANDISEHKRTEKNIQFLAHYDVLTGLPNRVLLKDRAVQMMAAAQRDGQKFALMFLDLDRFKYVNDTMGHAAGDKLLQEVARRLTECIREGDTVSRIGGDEFILLLRDTGEVGASRVAEEALRILKAEFVIEGIHLSSHASVGISIYPTHAGDIDTLIRHADMAMYHAKGEGRNNYQFYAPEMALRTTYMFAMEKDLQQALAHGQFSLAYQPQARLSDGQICGIEVLLRWDHPEKGNVPPDEFIPIAEETGQIMLIGDWVLVNACAQMAEWKQHGISGIVMAINLSIRTSPSS